MKRVIIIAMLILGISKAYSQEQTEFKFRSDRQIVFNINNQTLNNQVYRYFIYNKEEGKLYEYKTKKFKKLLLTKQVNKVWYEGDWKMKCNLVESDNSKTGEAFFFKALDEFTNKSFTVEYEVSKYYE